MARASSTKSKASTTKSRASKPIDIVYVGPTLAAAEVRALLPDADVRGPVAVGDVLRILGEHAARRVRIGRIAIIDGYFERMAAVWHKEILLAIEAGIEVWGAASMGALRAAELAPFGMRGIGTIYERFASGELVADDEVAVAHLPAEYGYRCTSVALVDLREGIEQVMATLATDSVVATDSALAKERERLIELARAPFYRERSWERLIADAQAGGISKTTIEALQARGLSTTTSRDVLPSRKAADARLLLETMARTAKRPSLAKPTRTTAKFRVPRTWALAQLRAFLGR